MVPLYKPQRAFDAQLVYTTWLTLIAEEPLYEALQKGRHAAVARRLGLSEEQILILDDFASQPGTQWHIENLRFRCATMVGRALKWQLPGTVELLTQGLQDWLRDLTYEYMSHSRWQDLGHHQRGAECLRFAEFVRERVLKRRPMPAHLDTVLTYELCVLELEQAASQLPDGDWPAREPQVPDFQWLKPRPAPATRTCELAADIVDWLAKPVGSVRVAAAGAVQVLIWVPSAAEPARSERLAPANHQLLGACDGKTTVAELARRDPESAATLRTWFAQGVLTDRADHP